MTPDTPSTGSGLNEIVPFSNVPTVRIYLTETRRQRFGDALVLYVEIKGEDDQYRQTSVQIIPNQVPDTQYYDIDVAGINTGRVVIT
jgi:hypothetical protein